MKDNKIFVWLVLCLFCAFCTACSPNEDREEIPGAGDGSASMASVSGNALQEGGDSDDSSEHLEIELENKRGHFFANKNSRFMEVSNEQGEVIGFDQLIQVSGHRNEFRPERFVALLGVTDEGVYYAKRKESGTGEYVSALYRIPFGKGKGEKAHLDEEKEELVLEEPNGFRQDQAAYIDSRYIIYLPYMECVIKYDRETKEKIELPTGSDTMTIVTAGEDVVLLADLTKNDESLYRLALDSDQVETVWTDSKHRLDAVMTVYDQYLFCVRGDAVWAYDISNNQKEQIVSQEALLQAGDQVTEMTGGGKVGEVYVENLFCYNNRLYVQLQLNWMSGQNEKMGYAMFYIDLSDKDRKLLYEVSISNCMRTRSAEKTHAITPTISWNSGRCHDITEDGQMILILNRSGVEEQQLGYFNIRSREFKLIGEEDREFFIPYMDQKSPFGNEDSEIAESYMCVMSDDLY